MSLCHDCLNCWGTTKDGKAICVAYPSGRYEGGIPVHDFITVDQRDECDLFEEDEDWSDLDETDIGNCPRRLHDIITFMISCRNGPMKS